MMKEREKTTKILIKDFEKHYKLTFLFCIIICVSTSPSSLTKPSPDSNQSMSNMKSTWEGSAKAQG